MSKTEDSDVWWMISTEDINVWCVPSMASTEDSNMVGVLAMKIAMCGGDIY